MGIIGIILGIIATGVVVVFTFYMEYVVGSLVAKNEDELVRLSVKVGGLGTLILDFIICFSPILTAVQLYFAERPELYETPMSAAVRGGGLFVVLVSVFAFLVFYGVAIWSFETYSVYSSEEEEEDFQDY
ncbi:hypothetical protein IJG71_03535 [Candidatus Saccharibacteria bacterium]|nr:hypothetical protein [Candidatus Saccharibacteria bacterium]